MYLPHSDFDGKAPLLSSDEEDRDTNGVYTSDDDFDEKAPFVSSNEEDLNTTTTITTKIKSKLRTLFSSICDHYEESAKEAAAIRQSSVSIAARKRKVLSVPTVNKTNEVSQQRFVCHPTARKGCKNKFILSQVVDRHCNQWLKVSQEQPHTKNITTEKTGFEFGFGDVTRDLTEALEEMEEWKELGKEELGMRKGVKMPGRQQRRGFWEKKTFIEILEETKEGERTLVKCEACGLRRGLGTRIVKVEDGTLSLLAKFWNIDTSLTWPRETKERG